MKKLSLPTLALIIAISAVLPVPVGAQTAGTNDAALQAQIVNSQNQIQALTSQIGDSGSATANTIKRCAIVNRFLGVGSRGSDVSSLQQFLSDQGVFTAQPTGYYGQLTAQAVTKLQGQNGVSQVGTVGPITRALILTKCAGGVGTIPPPTTITGCTLGALFNSLTGAPCSTTPTTTPQTQESATITGPTQSSAQTLTLTGTATGVTQVGIAINSSSGDKIFGSGLVAVVNGLWSVTVTPKLGPGQYTIYAYDANNIQLASLGITIAPSNSGSVLISNATASLGQCTGATNTTSNNKCAMTMSFTVTNLTNSDIFINKVPSAALVTSSSPSTPATSLQSINISAAPGDTATSYDVWSNSSRTFTYVGTISGPAGGGYESFKINQINYGTNPTNPIGSSITSGLDNLSVSTILGSGTSPAAITVLSPNGGETVAIGETLSVIWNSSIPTQPVDVKIIDAGGNVLSKLIALNVTPANASAQSLGFATVISGSSLLTPGQYKARVCSAGTNNCDDSNATFTVIPAVTQVSPNISGMTPQPVLIGSNLTISLANAGRQGSVILQTQDGSKSWSTGYATDISALPGFSLYNGSTLSFTIPSTIGRGVNPGMWNEPTVSLTPGNYNLYVTALDANNNFVKSNTVTIAVGSNSVQTPPPAAATISVLSPNGGESITSGQTYSITWSTNRDSSKRVDILITRGDDPLNPDLPLTVKTIDAPNTGSYQWTVPAGDPNVNFPCANGTCSTSGTKFKVSIFYPDLGIGTFDASDNYFTITPTVFGFNMPVLTFNKPTVTASNASASIMQCTGATNSSPNTRCAIMMSFTITNIGNSDIFIAKDIGTALVTVSNPPTASTSLQSINISAGFGDTATAYDVSSNSSRTFTYNGSMGANAGGGFESFKITQINYGTNPSSPTGSSITSGLDNLFISQFSMANPSGTNSLSQLAASLQAIETILENAKAALGR